MTLPEWLSSICSTTVTADEAIASVVYTIPASTSPRSTKAKADRTSPARMICFRCSRTSSNLTLLSAWSAYIPAGTLMPAKATKQFLEPRSSSLPMSAGWDFGTIKTNWLLASGWCFSISPSSSSTFTHCWFAETKMFAGAPDSIWRAQLLELALLILTFTGASVPIVMFSNAVAISLRASPALAATRIVIESLVGDDG